MQKWFLLVLIIALLFVFGCSGSSPSGKFDENKLRQFVNDPSVVISSEKWSSERVQQSLLELNAKCANGLSPKPYLVVYAKGPNTDLTIFVDEGSQVVSCVVDALVGGGKEIGFGGCRADADCDDGLASTVDLCLGEPKSCSNERVQQCVSGDSYCPRNCVKSNDSDCARACVGDSDCDDANVLTSDICTGIVKACRNEPIIVGGKALKSCEADADCADESNSCVVGVCGEEKTCSYSNEVNGSECSLKMECFDGACQNPAKNSVQIFGVNLKSLSENSVEISWKTNKLANSVVKYGDITYQLKKEDNSNKIDHLIVLANLIKGQKYEYKVESTDSWGVSTVVFKNAQSFFFTCNSCAAGLKCDALSGQCMAQ